MTDAPGTSTTLVEVLDGLRQEGYTGTFVTGDDGDVLCRACGTRVPAEAVQLDGIRRVEGASDPGDMAAVLAIHCDSCGTKGSVVARYGPEAGPADAALLLAIDDHRSSGLDVAESASQAEPRAAAPHRGRAE
jgi:hypothetical protein